MLEQLEKSFELPLKAELWHTKEEWDNKVKGWRFFPCYPIIVACTWHTPLQSTQPPLRAWQKLFLMSASDDTSWGKIFLRFVKLASEVPFLVFKQRRKQKGRMAELGIVAVCPGAKAVVATLVWVEVWNIICELLTEQWESHGPKFSQGNQTSTASGDEYKKIHKLNILSNVPRKQSEENKGSAKQDFLKIFNSEQTWKE